MFKKRVSTKAGVRIIATLLCALLFLLIFVQGASAADMGDVNESGTVNVEDVILVQKHILEIKSLTVAQKALADVNGNGDVTIDDAVLIMRFALGLITEFPSVSLNVTSVTAVNPKQVEVVFNRVLKPDEKTKMVSANFHIGLQAAPATNRLTGPGSAVAIKDDNKTVLLTMADGFNFVNGTTTNRVVVKKEVGLNADYTNAIVGFVDTSVPTLVSVETISPRRIVLTFSEPLDKTIVPNNYITLNASAIALNLTGATYVDARRELIIDAFSDLPTGSHTLAILIGTNLKDYSGFPVVPTSKTFTHTPITTAPTVSAKLATVNSVTIEFSRPIDAATLVNNSSVLFRHTIEGSTLFQVDGTKVSNPSGDNTTFVIDFTSKTLPVGSTTLWMKYADGTSDANKVKDTWGNIVTPFSLPVTTTVDTTAPTATVSVHSSTQIDVQYSKAVQGATTLSNYSLKQGTTVVTLNNPVSDLTGNKYRLTAAAPLQGTYTLTISNIKDTSPSENPMGTQTFAINVPDTTPPTVNTTSKLLPGTPNPNKVQIYFSEAMNPASITDRSKYTYKTGAVDIAVPAAVIFTPASNGKSVLLDFSSTAITFVVGNNITVGRVKDLAGNETAALSTVTSIADGDYITIEKAEATVVNRVTLTIDALITNVSPNDFAIDPGTGTYAKAASLVTVSYSGGKTIIVLSTATNLPYTAAGVLVRTDKDAITQGPTVNARDEFGNKLEFNDEVVADKIAPILLTAKRLDNITIELTFSEDLKSDTFAAALANGFSVAGSTITSIRGGVGSENKVTVARTGGTVFTTGTTQVGYTAGSVADDEGNKLASFSPVTITN